MTGSGLRAEKEAKDVLNIGRAGVLAAAFELRIEAMPTGEVTTRLTRA